MKNYNKIALSLIICILAIVSLVACTKDNVFKVTFIVDDETISTISSNGRETINLPNKPSKQGYIFTGWFFDKNVWEHEFTENSFQETVITENIYVYAKWIKNTTQSITPTMDLKYTLKEDGNSYSVDVYNGNSTNIVIPNEYNGLLVTSIAENAFANSNITKIFIPSTIKNIGISAFSDCTNLTQISFNAYDMQDLNYNNRVFSNAGVDTSGITVTIGNNVKKIPAHLFNPYDKSCAPNIIIVNFEDNSICESIQTNAFRFCYKLKKINLPESLTTIVGLAFSNCESLISITIPKGVINFGEYIFSECKQLTIYFEIENEPSDWYSSRWNNAKCSVYWGINNETFIEFQSAQYVLINGNAILTRYVGSDTTFTIPKTVTINGTIRNIIGVGELAFSNEKNLISVAMENNITYIGNNAFSNCESLENVTMRDGVTSIGNYAFSNCKSLNNLTLSDSITIIGEYAFVNCTSLTSLLLPTSLITISERAFSLCKGLNTNIVIPNGVANIGKSAFEHCTSIKSITIPLSVLSIGEGAFYNCSSMTIYCEATEKQEGWNYWWNWTNCPVVWNN